MKERHERMSSRVAFVAGRMHEKGPTVGDLRNVAQHAKEGIQRDRFETKTELLLRQLSIYGKDMKSTYFHVKIERKKLLGIMASAETKSPVWFGTLSSGDLFWPELWIAIFASNGVVITYEDASKLELKERNLLLKENPALACIMFRSRINCLFKHIICGEAHPLGKIVEYWLRTEFQGRGSLHVHAILWAFLHFEDKWLDGDQLSSMIMNNNNDKDVLLDKDGCESNLSIAKVEQHTVSTDKNNMEVHLTLNDDSANLIENNQVKIKIEYETHERNIVHHESLLINNFITSSRKKTLNLNTIGQRCKNINNTCWLSSLLQCLIHSNSMLSYMTKMLNDLTFPLDDGITKTT